MEPYVFHCTPCGKAHAGECPPGKRVTIAKTTVHVRAPIIDGVPQVGSQWVVQKASGSISAPWQVYVVVGTQPDGRIRIQEVGKGYEHDYDPGAWTSSWRGGWQFVPVP